jgi:hypothetical protein
MKLITVTITEDGDQLFLKGHGAEVFGEAGPSRVRRASHIVPENLWARLAFRTIRFCVHDTSRLAAWTRGWRCLWRVDTKPVGGPILADRFTDRQAAINAEIQFLNKYFLEETL